MGTPKGQAGGFEQSPGNGDMALSATDDLEAALDSDLLPTEMNLTPML
jgi:hypothetical protein